MTRRMPVVPRTCARQLWATSLTDFIWSFTHGLMDWYVYATFLHAIPSFCDVAQGMRPAAAGNWLQNITQCFVSQSMWQDLDRLDTYVCTCLCIVISLNSKNDVLSDMLVAYHAIDLRPLNAVHSIRLGIIDCARTSQLMCLKRFHSHSSFPLLYGLIISICARDTSLSTVGNWPQRIASLSIYWGDATLIC